MAQQFGSTVQITSIWFNVHSQNNFEIYINLKFNGCVFRQSEKAGYQGIVVSQTNQVVISFAGPILVCSSNEAEVMRLWRGVKELEQLEAKLIIVEGDSFVVTQWASGSSCPWRLLDKIEEIRMIIKGLDPKISHGPRSANGRADDLAKRGSLLQQESISRFGVVIQRREEEDYVFFLRIWGFWVDTQFQLD